MSSRKVEHLNERIRQKLGAILARRASDPRFERVTVTEVEVSPDGAEARVRFACYDTGVEPGAVEAALNQAAGFFSKALGRTLQTRRTPRLHFTYDRGFDHADRIERLLHEADGTRGAPEAADEPGEGGA